MGIPMKNLALIDKKPLLYYTVNASLRSKLVNRTIVTTDHKKISDYAKKLGADVIRRPKKLAGSKITTEPSMTHVLTYLKQRENYIPDVVILLQNTSPLRNANHIDEAIKYYIKGNYDSVLSGFSTHYFLWKTTKSNLKPLNYNPLKRPNRQNIKGFFIENGAIYITKYSLFTKNGCRVSGKIGLYEMSRKLSTDIDYFSDLIYVENLIKEIKSKK